MSLKQFLHYLTEEDGRSISVNNGVITASAARKPLRNTPDGWQDILIAWERNLAKHGIVRNYSREIGLVRDAATIVRDAFYRANVERKIYWLIQKLHLDLQPTYWRWIYKYFYKGELDMSTFKDSPDKVTIQIMEGGLSKYMKANEGTIYEIPFDDDAVNLKLDGIKLFQKAKFTSGITVSNTDYLDTVATPLFFVSREGTQLAAGITSQNLENVTGGATAYCAASSNYFLINNSDAAIDFDLTGTIKVACTNNTIAAKLRLFFMTDGGTQYDFYNPGTTLVAGTAYDIPVSETITLQPGEKLFCISRFFGLYPGGSVDVTVDYLDSTELFVNFSSTYKTTYCKAFTRKTLFRKLMNKVAGSEDYAVSELLDTDDRLITSGDAIRGIAGAVLKTTLNDFFTDLDTDLCAGIGIEIKDSIGSLPPGQYAVIESRAHWYDASSPIALGDIKDLETSYATELVGNRIKVGWRTPQIEDVNGKYDFNAGNQFSLPITRVAKELNLVSPYKAGPYEIEVTRINLDGKTTTDKNNDSDVFVIVGENGQPDANVVTTFRSSDNSITVPDNIQILAGQRIRITGSAGNDNIYTVDSVQDQVLTKLAILSGGVITTEGPITVLMEWLTGRPYKLKRYTWDNAGDPTDFGAPDPTTVFNTDLSPIRKLKRNGQWLHGMLHNFEGSKVKFESGERNTGLKTVLAGVTVKENADLLVNTLGDKLFLPVWFDFETKVPIDLVDILEASANRCFSFVWDDVTYKGFLVKAGIAPNTRQTQQYKLLAAPDNDLTQLI